MIKLVTAASLVVQLSSAAAAPARSKLDIVPAESDKVGAIWDRLYDAIEKHQSACTDLRREVHAIFDANDPWLERTGAGRKELPLVIATRLAKRSGLGAQLDACATGADGEAMMARFATLGAAKKVKASAPAPSACPVTSSALSAIDQAPIVVRVRFAKEPGEQREGANMRQGTVVAALRGKQAAGATLEVISGGPCARDLAAVTDELVLPVVDGRIDAGTRDTLPASLALQTAIAKTPAKATKQRAALVLKAATAKYVTRSELVSIKAYLDATPDVAAKLSAADRAKLDRALAAL